VWACQDRDNTAKQIEAFFGINRYNIKFALFSKKENPSPNETDELVPVAMKRDLEIIFSKHQQYTKENTLIISNFKNELSDYRSNEIIIPLYHPIQGTTSFTADAHLYYLMEYLVLLYSNFEGAKGKFLFMN
jgi:hypothetical protein